MPHGYLFTDQPLDNGDLILQQAQQDYKVTGGLPVSRSLLHALLNGRGKSLLCYSSDRPLQSKPERYVLHTRSEVKAQDFTDQLIKFSLLATAVGLKRRQVSSFDDPESDSIDYDAMREALEARSVLNDSPAGVMRQYAMSDDMTANEAGWVAQTFFLTRLNDWAGQQIQSSCYALSLGRFKDTRSAPTLNINEKTVFAAKDRIYAQLEALLQKLAEDKWQEMS